MNNYKDKILGALLGAAVGDSMGTISEGFSPEFLKKRYSGYIEDLLDPTDDGMTVNAHAGMVSDDFSVAYYTAEVMLEARSKITPELAKKGLLRWWEHPEYTCYCGPSTKKGIMRLMDSAGQETPDTELMFNNKLVTNGAGMKAGLMGLFNPENPQAAVRDAITMCSLTHTNPLSLAGACAAAGATAAAFGKGISYLELIQAGIASAKEGYELTAPHFGPLAGGDIERRIGLATEIGLKYQHDFEKAMITIADTIGCGIYAYEAIPAAFGMIAATKGETMPALIMSVNAGSDADSVACIIGYILGAYRGTGSMPDKFLSMIDTANDFSLEHLAEGILKIVEEAANDK